KKGCVVSSNGVREQRDVFPLGRWRRGVFAKEQLDFTLVSSHQGCLKSATGAASPLRHCRQTFHNGPDDFPIAASERHSQQIVAILAAGFRAKVRGAGQQLPKDFEIAVHGGGHERRKTIFVSKIDKRTGTHQALRRFPILLGRCDQQRCPALGIMPVWINVIDQAQFDQRVPLNCNSANKFARRNGDARGRFWSKRRRPEQNQNYDAYPKDESPLEHAHMQGWASYYMCCVQPCNRGWIELRGYLRVSRDWTYPVERCMFPAVQIPTHAFIHFAPVRCTQYIVRRATRGCSDLDCSRRCGRGGQRGRSSIEQSIFKKC